MKQKIILSLLLLLAILSSVTCTVLAAADHIVMQDSRGDVMILTEDIDPSTLEGVETTDQKPNIDIKTVTYSKPEGSTRATLELEVYGVIENKGDPYDPLSFEMITYTFYISTHVGTSNLTYEIIYINNDCILYNDAMEEINITDFSVDGAVLTIPFTLSNSAEQNDLLSAQTMEFSATSSSYYMDIAPDVPLSAEIDESYDGKAGQAVEFSSIAYGGSTPYIYAWDFGDGGTSTDKDPSHTYTAVGEYNITLTVTDDAQATTTASGVATITTSPPPPESNQYLLLLAVVIILIVVVGVLILIYIIRRR